VASRYDKERQFHDTLVEGEHGRAAGRFYAVNVSSWDFYWNLLLTEARNREGGEGVRILEYGCGAGAYSSIELAKVGLTAVGVDLSEASVAAARERAEREVPGRSPDYRVMNAEALDFADASFDLVCGNGVLHHLDLARAYGEIARVLRPGGAAIFTEPLGHNPLINLYRRLTPAQRTEDEHPLRTSDLKLAGSYFGGAEAWYFHLFVLAATPLRDTPLFEAARRSLDAVDRAVLRTVPSSRKLAWQVVLRLTRPLAAA
jgi:SAM-dependent methyltransferase